MDTEQCEELLREYTEELHNIFADRQQRMPTPKLHRAYSDLASINQQFDPNFNQEEVILTRITELVNYVEHFHLIEKRVTLKSLLSLYLGTDFDKKSFLSIMVTCM